MSVTVVQDYQIIQRDPSGFAEADFSAELPENFSEKSEIYARVVSEDDNSIIAGWTKCGAENGRWKVSLRLPQGGLYRFEAGHTADGASPEWCARIRNICHIGVGDLYLLTGQSNMAGYGRDAAYDPPCLGVHLYGNNGRWSIATHPLNDSIGTIYPENAEYTTGTSPALSFGRTLKNKLGVPIGLIQASLGGSPLSAWNPAENGVLYRAMLRRTDVVGNVRGILWYQGCSDAISGIAGSYLERFAAMLSAWRERLGPVPVLTVQLNGWACNCRECEANDRQWGLLREAQRQASQTIPDVFVVPSMDLPIGDGIHNTSVSNVAIGERLAFAALSGIYKRGNIKAASVSAVERISDTQIMVRFPPECRVNAQDLTGKGMNVEDASGLIAAVSVENKAGGFTVTTERPFSLPAKFHAMWRCMSEGYSPKDLYGMPMLSCYGVEIGG